MGEKLGSASRNHGRMEEEEGVGGGQELRGLPRGAQGWTGSQDFYNACHCFSIRVRSGSGAAHPTRAGLRSSPWSLVTRKVWRDSRPVAFPAMLPKARQGPPRTCSPLGPWLTPAAGQAHQVPAILCGLSSQPAAGLTGMGEERGHDHAQVGGTSILVCVLRTPQRSQASCLGSLRDFRLASAKVSPHLH